MRYHLPHELLVGGQLAAAEGVGEQLGGERIVELVLMSVQIALQAGQSGDRRAVGQRQRIFDGLVVAVGFSPAAERVKMFEGKAERVDARVAIDARRLAAVRFESLADG